MYGWMVKNQTVMNQLRKNLFRFRLFTSAPLCLMAVSCGSGAPQRPASASSRSTAPESSHAPTRGESLGSATSAKTLEADTQWKTSSGATFTAPKRWAVSEAKHAIRLVDPDRELQLTFVENQEKDAASATLAAWKLVDASFSKTPRQTRNIPARDGWDEISQTEYETAGNEEHVLVAVARRKGTAWYVTLIDGTKAGFDKRAAQIMTAIGSFKAVGVEEESFAKRPAHVLDKSRLDLFTSFVEDARLRAKVVGASIGIVQHGHVVFKKGFGVTTVGTN